MNLITICIAFIVSIVSVGAPLVFQVVTKLDKDYNSQAINKIFEKGSKINWFKWLLILTLIVVGLYIIISAFYLSFDQIVAYKIISRFSALLIIPSALLVGLFVHFSFITLKFSKPTSLLNILIKKNKVNKYKNVDVVESLIDFSINAIQKKDLPTFREITNHFIDVFEKYKKNNKAELLPEKLYEIGYRITKELASNKDRDFDQFKQLTINNLWLIDNLNSPSDVWLWRNLIIAVENKEDEMILYYWKCAFQHFEYVLRIPDSIYSIPLSTEKENQVEIDQIKLERSTFLDFHYYLGGLLLSENRIESIRRVWDHTNSEPPRYPLLPSALGEIFKRYFQLCQIFDKDSWEKASRYSFPKVDSINFDWITNSWIRKYLILLFLRQYTLQKYYIYQEFLTLPKSPESQAIKKHWIDNIQRFTDGLKEVLNNTKLLKALRFDHMTEEWCRAENKIYPVELVNKFKRQLEEDFEQAIINQPVSPEKQRKFWTSSKDEFEIAIEEYKDVVTSNACTDGKNWRDPFYILGNWMIADKSIFAEDQPSDHLNYHSFFAEQIANKMRWTISETFLMVTTHGYLLKEEDLFKAIDKLKITENPNDFVIISFKNNIEYYIRVPNVQGLSKSRYNGVLLIDIWNCNDYIVGNTFFIVKKSELPWLEFKEPASKWGINWKEEEMIIQDKHISAAIIDLHEHPEVSQKLEEEGNKENLDDKVLVNIEMLALVHWKKGAKVIALQTASVYDDRGIPNKLEEVKPFDKI